MAITTNEALIQYPYLKEWAKKAREELRKHCIVTVDDGDYMEDFNDDSVITLCNEYDNLFKEEPEFRRADGHMLCSCGLSYQQHPSSEHLSYDNQPYLRKLCDGTLVKL